MTVSRLTLLAITPCCLLVGSVIAAEVASPQAVAAKIDQFMEGHWDANGVVPATLADDATFLRRVTLDLVGRIPTWQEVDKFLKDKSSDKRRQVIEHLINGPEFPLHFGNVLDQFIQGRHAGNEAFVDYLRRKLRQRKSWDALFREIMLGPWDSDEHKAASRFLDRRAKTLDVLTADAARVFFGVDISCAKCHDHPLVDDWTQDHFYGMAAFFNRTTGGKGQVGEKNDGEVTFQAEDGKEQTAKMMFLSGRVIDEPSAEEKKAAKDKRVRFSRREQLVNIALDEQRFFSRALVNRIWEYLFGRGLVSPVDQMHSGNKPAVPELLDWLADDFATSGYDLHRLLMALVTTRTYQLDSKWQQESSVPDTGLFAVARLRPLSRRQLAFSLLLATENFTFDDRNDIRVRTENLLSARGFTRIEQYLTVEGEANSLIASLDPRRADFQSSTGEALFMSNNVAVQKLVLTGSENVAANVSKRLMAMESTEQIVKTAIQTVLSRPPGKEEIAQLAQWFDNQRQDRRTSCEYLVWALVTSAEFRFNH